MKIFGIDESKQSLYSVSKKLEQIKCRKYSVFDSNLVVNLLTPNVNYSGHTAPLTSKVAFYIFIQQI